jgi:hypothetical protein
MAKVDILNKSEFTKWLLAYNGGREQFAKDTGISLGTVNNWCSNRPIPLSAQKRILELMQQSEQKDSGTSLVVPLTVAEFTRVEAAAADEGYRSIENFARDAIIEKAARLRAAVRTSSLRLNEQGRSKKLVS